MTATPAIIDDLDIVEAAARSGELPDPVVDFVAVLSEHMPTHKALVVTLALCQKIGGSSVRVPSPKSARCLVRDIRIHLAYSTVTDYRALAERFGLSVRGVYRAIARVRRLRERADLELGSGG